MSSENHANWRFRRFAVSNLCAQSAEQIGLAAAPILAVYLFRATPSQTALLQMVQSLPFLLLAIPAGVLADRVSRRRMVLGSELVRASAFGVILLLMEARALDLITLGTLGFIGAAGTVAYSVTLPGVTPLLVARDRLPTANSRLELARSIAVTAGPSIAGLLFNALGGEPTYAIAMVLSMTAIGLVATVPLHRPGQMPRRHLVRELREGFRFTFTNPHLRPVLFTAVAFNASWFMLQASFVPYAQQTLGLSAAGVGTAMSVYGTGMVFGALLTPFLANRLYFGTLVLVGPIGGFIGACFMTASVWISATPLVWCGFFFFGAGPVVWAATTATLRQAVTPDSLIGRVSAVITTFTFGARPIGALAAAIVAAKWGTSTCILAASAGFTVQLLIILSSRLRVLAGIPVTD
ncbi:MAG TPA: MFS transporter [Bordetella sp.]|jgi:predicted MFS family arabinose efflux permease|nr:MFS transporter [Bordetella sp.]